MQALFHTYSIAGHWYVFDANTNSVISVSEEQYKALNDIEHDRETQENLAVLQGLQEKGFCKEAVIERIYNANADIIEAHLDKKLQHVIIQLTQRCNLRCAYCAYSGKYKNRVHSPKSMNFEMAQRIIDMVLSHSEDTQLFVFGFYGGGAFVRIPSDEEMC